MTNRRDFLKLAIWASFLITINKISKVSEAEANPSYIVSRGTILYNILDLYVTHRLEDLGDGNFSKDGNYLVYYEIGTEDKFRAAAKVMIRNNSIHFGKISVNGRIVKLASCVDSCTSHDDCAGAPYMGCYPYCCSIDIECCAEECIYCLLCLLGSKIGCLLCLSLCTLMCLDSCCTQEANSCTSP